MKEKGIDGELATVVNLFETPAYAKSRERAAKRLGISRLPYRVAIWRAVGFGLP